MIIIIIIIIIIVIIIIIIIIIIVVSDGLPFPEKPIIPFYKEKSTRDYIVRTDINKADEET